MKNPPERTCIGCGRKADKTELARVVAAPAAVKLDPSGREPGRGAYICPKKECLDQAIARRGIGRALKREVSEAELTALLSSFEDEVLG